MVTVRAIVSGLALPTAHDVTDVRGSLDRPPRSRAAPPLTHRGRSVSEHTSYIISNAGESPDSAVALKKRANALQGRRLRQRRARSITSSGVSGALGWWERHSGVRTFWNESPSEAA